MRPLSRLLVTAVVLGLAPGCTGYKVVRRDKLNPPALRRVEERTAATRGLPFKEPVQAEVYSKKESGEYFVSQVRSDEERARREDRVAHRLGLLPDGASLQELFSAALTRNAAGVYVPSDDEAPAAQAREGEARPEGQGRLFIVTDVLPEPFRSFLGGFGYLTGTDWGNELFLSHELMHALQDQHFDLSRILPAGLYAKNEDMALARKSVVESEANLVAQAYLLGVDLDSVVQRNLLIEYLALGRSLDVLSSRLMNPELPPFYVKVLVEQYSQGMHFLQRATNQGGWSAVNHAYVEALPRSSEQLMWPEKFFTDTPDDPRPLPALADSGPLAGLARLESNVFGALLWRIFLEDYVSGGDALAAVKGWGGDRYDVFEAGERTLLVWRTLWDTADDAAEMAATYEEVLRGKYPDRLERIAEEEGLVAFAVAPKASGPETPGVRTSVPEVAVVARWGDRTLLVEGAAPERWRALVASLRGQVRDAPAAAPDVVTAGIDVARPAAGFVREGPPRLEKRVLLPHHTIAFRAGLGATLEHTTPGQVHVRPLLDRELRWGFREHLEWTPPYILSIEVPQTGPLQSVVTFGLAELGVVLEPRLALDTRPVFLLTEALHVHESAALVGQLGAEGSFSTDPARGPGIDLSGAFGVYLSPLPFLFVSAGLGLHAGWSFDSPAAIFDRSAYGQPPTPQLVVGAATQRGRSVQPTVELRLIDGLHLYESSQAFIDPGALRFLGHRHIAGLLLYF